MHYSICIIPNAYRSQVTPIKFSLPLCAAATQFPLDNQDHSLSQKSDPVTDIKNPKWSDDNKLITIALFSFLKYMED